MTLALDERGGRFTQIWDTQADVEVALPGDREHWPLDVREAGKRLAVIQRDAGPMVFLPRGNHALAGAFAWNRMPEVPIGAVYLRRTPDHKIKAFNVVCPHLGCPVDYDPASKGFSCPCHNSAFGLDGRISNPQSPSARGLDELPVEIRNDNEIWIKFQNFRASTKEKIPLA